MGNGEGCLAVVGVALALALLLIGVPMVSFYSDRAECSFAAQNAGVRTKFVKNHIYSWDCFVMVDGSWIPFDKWRGDSDN